jgi:transcriptional regulator with XRE-family HTH domain
MTRERIHSLLLENRIPQMALANLSGVDSGTISRWLRGFGQMSENQQDEMVFTLNAMLELLDASPIPPDWRQAPRLKPIISEKVASYRRARTAELARQYNETISGAATA